MTGFRTVLLLLLVAGAACSTDFSPQSCSLDGDCGDGLVCELRDGQSACVTASDATILVGQSAPQTGANQALGTGMKLGIQLAFDERNTMGGIRGRQLELVSRDDGYSPELAEANARSLVDVQASSAEPKCPSTRSTMLADPILSSTALSRGSKAVLAILGNVGTPTMVRSAPIAIETGTVFFGAFTGASTLLRDSLAGPACGRYIFNVRASYAQEAKATIEYFQFRGINNYKNLISFDQADSFGQNGYDGLIDAYKAKYSFPAGVDANTAIFRVQYTRNDAASVPLQADLTKEHLRLMLASVPTGDITVGIFMTDTYGAGTDFIRAMRTWQYDPAVQQPPLAARQRLTLVFSNVSFVGANSLADRLRELDVIPGGNGARYTEDVLISQVVPNYQSDSSEVIMGYKAAIAATPGAVPSFTSLEGYISARVFIAGLELNKGPFTATSILDAFEALPDLGLGVGASSGFSSSNHQYSNSVWGTAVTADGGFRNVYFWTAGHEIQFFE